MAINYHLSLFAKQYNDKSLHYCTLDHNQGQLNWYDESVNKQVTNSEF